jgi:DEAD/DEAH box helicase domain-containing protein
MNPGTVYFHLETRSTIAEVGGWEFRHLAGVSAAALICGDQVQVYRGVDVHAALPVLRSAERVVGYNLQDFDLPVLRHHTGMDITDIRSLDLLQEVWRVTGKRWSLDVLAAVTLGLEREADSLKMVQAWQAGREDEVIAGCVETVTILRLLHLHGFTHPSLHRGRQ